MTIILSIFMSLSSYALSDSISCRSLDKSLLFSMSQNEHDEIKIYLNIDREVPTDLAITEMTVHENSISFGINDLADLRAYTFISSDSFDGHNAKFIAIGEAGAESTTFKLNCIDK